MRIQTLVKRNRVEAPVEHLRAWHRSGALELLMPPGAPVRLLQRRGGIENGAVAIFFIGYVPLRIEWMAVHRDCIPNRSSGRCR